MKKSINFSRKLKIPLKNELLFSKLIILFEMRTNVFTEIYILLKNLIIFSLFQKLKNSIEFQEKMENLSKKN